MDRLNVANQKLLRNDAKDFANAMTLVREAHTQEGDSQLGRIYQETLAASVIYSDAITEAAAKMRAAGLDTYADALESGDYTALAL